MRLPARASVLLPYRFTLLSNDRCGVLIYCIVLLPYRFTLLSNHKQVTAAGRKVLLPYRFTLLSNKSGVEKTTSGVLLPYRFTLLSNIDCRFSCYALFYYLIDLHYSQTSNCESKPRPLHCAGYSKGSIC